MKNALILTALLAIVALSSVPVIGETLEPLTVSPGAVDRATGVEVRCPTFSWQMVPGAAGYEVVVYELPPQTELAAWSLDDAVEVLFVELPTGVTAWTPELELGLTRGANHVWFVRGVFEAEAEDATGWSAARFFRVAGRMEVGSDATLSRQGVVPSGVGEGVGEGEGGVPSRGTTAEGNRSVMAKRVGETKTKDVGTAMAAIRGEMPNVTGETYGVVGTSNSPDGGGLGAANTAGGPDLVLDGVEDGETDALISQSGIRRSSAGIETFSFENTGGGDMHLGVIGTIHGNGSGLVDVDAETLNGHDSSAFSPVVHLHDDRYYTETELNTSGAGGSVNWNNLAAVPPGFADGVDDEATFNAGPGIIIDNGQVRVDSTAFTTQLSTIDGPGDIVLTTSIAIGTDGLGLISFYEFTGQDLKVAQCNDAVCSGAATATLDSGGVVGFSTSIAIGADGLGLISYRDATNEDLKAAHLGIGVP